MDRNSAIGLFLIFLILIGTYYFTAPSKEELELMRRQQDSIAALAVTDTLKAPAAPTSETQPDEEEIAPAVMDSASLASLDSMQKLKWGVFADAATGTEKSVTLENDLIRAEFSTLGGQLISLELKKFKRAARNPEDRKPLYLFEEGDARFNLIFTAKGASDRIESGKLYFTPSSLAESAIDDDSATLVFTATTGTGAELQQIYTLRKGSYLLDYAIRSKGLDKIIAPGKGYFFMDWAMSLPLQEQTLEAENRTSTIYYRNINGDVDYLPEAKDKEEKLAGNQQWVAFKQQFFNSTLIVPEKEGLEVTKISNTLATKPGYVRDMAAEVYIPFNYQNDETYHLQFYFGPNKYRILRKMDLKLERLIPLGWGIFGWVNKLIVIPVFDFFSKFVKGYGLIILFLTLVIKILLFPLVYKSYISAAKMRILKPEMDEIKEKCGDDLAKVQQENMKLFKKAGVSPFGGCVPLLLQFPILIALFQFFPASIELRQQGFLWAHDLSTYDSVLDLPFNIPFYGSHVSLFTLLMTVSTILYTRFNNQITEMQAQMKIISYIMPVVFMGVFNNYPAALGWYYFAANVITIGQQIFMRRFVNEEKLHAQIQENKKKPVKESAFQKRLADMAKRQQQIAASRSNGKPNGKKK